MHNGRSRYGDLRRYSHDGDLMMTAALRYLRFVALLLLVACTPGVLMAQYNGPLPPATEPPLQVGRSTGQYDAPVHLPSPYPKAHSPTLQSPTFPPLTIESPTLAPPSLSSPWAEEVLPPPGLPSEVILPSVVSAEAPWLEIAPPRDDWYISALARGYFFDDQRIEWSGLEATFGVEAAVAGAVRRQQGDWLVSLDGELYFNQRNDRNILVDTLERQSYLGNWDVDVLEISQLYLTARNGDFFIALGKMVTPFGRTYFPLYQNARSDAPFIRTESILWRETGLLLQYDPGNFTFTAALMNGGDDRDANSSKALVSRIGYDTPTFALGVSLKAQDGIGSEGQKTYNEHIGMDLMVRRGGLTFSAEAIYDQYGFRRPGFNPNNITWRRSIYYRDQNFANYQAITGFGYYANLGYESRRWTAMLNYGEFYPKQIGDPRHDVTTRRGIVKLIYHSSATIDTYGMVLLENDVPGAQANRLRKGIAVLIGFQIAL